MATFNKVILMGNIVRNPELRLLPSGKEVTTTSIAVNRKYKDKEETMFIDIVVYGKLAEIMNTYVTQGMPLLIEGRLHQDRWEKDGVKRYKHEIIVDSFQMLGKKQSDSYGDAAAFADDDIPF